MGGWPMVQGARYQFPPKFHPFPPDIAISPPLFLPISVKCAGKGGGQFGFLAGYPGGSIGGGLTFGGGLLVI